MTTPGPWTHINREGEYIVKGADGQLVFIIRQGLIPRLEDARLLEAASELLEALKACLPFVASHMAMTNGDWEPISDRLAYDKAESVIAKVEGKGVRT